MIMNVIFFLISGKAYSIFALMFGFSFFIQMSRQEERGADFRLRFFWRLTLLLCFGFLHSLIYKGDILHMYALLGLPLLLLYKWNTKALVALAILLALQVPILYKLTASLLNPMLEFTGSFGSQYWLESNATYATGSLADVINFNFWKGRANVWGWMYYNGRYMQLVALFIAGLVLGRTGFFNTPEKYTRRTILTLAGSILLILLITLGGRQIDIQALTGTQRTLLFSILQSYNNLGYTALIVCVFVLAYIRFRKLRFFDLLAYYGKMSLSNYILQALIGVFFFYGFGLGMYRYLGSGWSLIYGILFVALQLAVSRIWIRYYVYGPLEWLWRALTWFNFNIPFRRNTRE
jgi:uncharacterized protein